MANIISSGTSTVTSGVTLYNPHIINSGWVVITGGGKVSGAIIENGGTEVVSAGGLDIGAEVSSGGALLVVMKGSASNNVVSSAALMVSGGCVYNPTVKRGASLVASGVSSGLDTVLGLVRSGSVVSSGNLVLHMNAIGSGFQVLSGYAFVSSGGLLQDSLVSGVGGSSGVAEIIIEKGGSGYANNIRAFGSMGIRSGGTATATNVSSGGYVYVSNGGLLSGGTVYSGGYVGIRSGGTAVSAVVASDGLMNVSSGGVCSNPILMSSGRVYVSGGKVSCADVHSGGIYVYSGGSTRSCYIASGILMLLGASSIEDTIRPGGRITIEKSTETGSLGYAEDLTLQSSASCDVYSGGSIHGGTVSSGGSLYVLSGGKIDGVNVRTGGKVVLLESAFHSGGGIGGLEYISSGASATKLNVLAGGSLTVVGYASGGSIYASGTATVESGGRYYGVSAGSKARLVVSSGGTATVGSASGLMADVSGTLALYSGAAYSCNVYGRMHLSSGSGVSGTSAARASYVNVLNGGTLEVGAYCSALNASVCASSGGSSAGWLMISSGGYASGGVVQGDMFVRSSATVKGMEFCSGGYGAVSGYMGQCYISGKASVRLYYGGSAYQTTVGSGGFMSIENGAKCDIATIASGGTLYVSSGASATNVYINNGYGRIVSCGVLSSCTVNSGGNVSLYGTAADVTIASGGSVKVWADGLFDGATIQNGGTLDLYSRTIINGVTVLDGGRVTAGGSLTLSSGALTYMGSTGVFDFNIGYGTISSGTVLVRNFDAISGTPLYTLTVSDTQAKGTYMLAYEASKFGSSTITVRNFSGTTLGTLALDTKTRIGDKEYYLNLREDNLLSVAVSAAAPAGTARSDINANGYSDVMFQYTGGEGQGQIGFWMDGTSTWKSTNSTHPTDVWEVLGAYDMNANGKADSVLVGNTEISGIKGAFIGYYTDASDYDSNWVNISYLTNYEGYVWKNKVGNITGHDGMNSIVWHTADIGALGVWTDGTDHWVSLGAGYDENWTLIGCGDFTDAGWDSVVMSYKNGEKYYAIDYESVAVELATSDSGWEVRAIGDFSGDKKDDIVAFHKETGIVAMWGNGSTSNWSQLGQLDPKDWFVAGAGDYNGDGKDDLLVRQISTGMLGYYGAANMDDWVELGRGVDMNWTVIA